MDALDRVPQEQRRRRVRPLQVVEDQHRRPLPRDERQDACDRVEQAVPAHLGLDGKRFPELRHAPCEAGDQAAQLAELRPELAGERGVPAFRDEVVDGGHERLVRHERLRVGSPVEHDRPGGVRFASELTGESRLPDPRLTTEHDELPRAVTCTCVAVTHAPEDRLTPYERLVAALEREHRREGHGAVRGGRSVRRRLAADQAAMKLDQVRTRHEPGFIPQPLAELMEGLRGHGDVPLGSLRLHQQRPGRLPRAARRDRAPRRRERVTPLLHPQGGGCTQLECLDSQVGNVTPDLLQPLGVVAGQHLTGQLGEDRLRRLRRGRPLSARESEPALLERLFRIDDVDAQRPAQPDGSARQLLQALAAQDVPKS